MWELSQVRLFTCMPYFPPSFVYFYSVMCQDEKSAKLILFFLQSYLSIFTVGMADQFCLRWNNFQSNIVSALDSLKCSEDLVDVTLTCEGRNIKAHKVILSACSPYFRNVFKVNDLGHKITFIFIQTNIHRIVLRRYLEAWHTFPWG